MIPPHTVIFYRDGICNELRTLRNLEMIVPEVIDFTHHCEHYDLDARLAEAAFLLIHRRHADALFSIDYYPILAEVAHTVHIPYISWIIDAPHYTLYSPTSLYDEVYIHHFDREEADRLRSSGRRNVFHEPLASDPAYFSSVIAAARQKNMLHRYQADISFLGSSYQNQYDYFARQSGLSDYDRGYFDALISAQLPLYGTSIIPAALSPEHISSLLRACDLKIPKLYDLPSSLVAENAIEKRVSVLERKKMIESVAERFGITLYSYEDNFPIPGVDYRGYANYETQMPLTFAASRINLNTTLRSIRSGIPLRALDIMGCGGFLLSNYQPELLEYFEPGRDLEIYEDIEDLLEKCAWYLEHEDTRMKIARRGLELVREKFSYQNALRNILSHI